MNSYQTFLCFYIYLTELDSSSDPHMDSPSRFSHFVEGRGRVVRWHVKPKSQILCIATKNSQVPLIHLNEDLNTWTAEKKSHGISCEAFCLI